MKQMKVYTEIVPFEMAQALKAAGFNRVVSEYWAHFAPNDPRIEWRHAFTWDDFNHEPEEHYNALTNEYEKPQRDALIICSAPTYADVVDWIIEKGIFAQSNELGDLIRDHLNGLIEKAIKKLI